ncbi:CRISPR-associated endonuclease Cas1 [Paraglaciecola sp. Hal342]
MQLSFQHQHLAYAHGCLTYGAKEAAPQRLPLKAIDTILVDNHCQISAELLIKLAQQNTSLIVQVSRGLPVCTTAHSAGQRRVGVKKQWYAITNQPDVSNLLARRLVLAKLRSRRKAISQLVKRTPNAHLDVLAVTHAPLANLAADSELSTLLGIEGAYAAKYFRALRHFTPAWGHFTKRQKRPPTDPINALLSLSYTLYLYQSALISDRLRMRPAVFD